MHSIQNIKNWELEKYLEYRLDISPRKNKTHYKQKNREKSYISEIRPPRQQCNEIFKRLKGKVCQKKSVVLNESIIPTYTGI